MELLQIGSRVNHFDGGPNYHGIGTVIRYNGQPKNQYLEEFAAKIATATIREVLS